MKNLVWCSVDATKDHPAIFGTDANYDILLHNYSDIGFKNACPPPGCVQLDAPHEEKFQVASREMPNRIDDYDYFAFLDDDLQLNVDTLNRLFTIGDSCSLALFQPALTPTSFCSHPFLRQQTESIIRRVPFVEIMCPFFSRDALRACIPTFNLNLSAWGLDCFLWPRKVNQECYVVDRLPVGHYNEPSRRDRVMANGKTPAQECLEIQMQLQKPTQ